MPKINAEPASTGARVKYSVSRGEDALQSDALQQNRAGGGEDRFGRGEGKSRDPVPAIGRSQQRKWRRVLTDLQQLAIECRPAQRAEVESEGLDFSEERVFAGQRGARVGE